MLDAHKATELATSALHVIGGLYGAWTHIMVGDLGGSVLVSLTVAACVLILAGATALAEIIRVKVQRYVQRHEQQSLPEPRDKGRLNA
jgi:uncharacterized protein (DUF2062 family)